MGNGNVRGGLGQGDGVLLGGGRLHFNQNVIGAGSFRGDSRNLIAALGGGVAVPHFVVAGGIAPKETYVVVSAVVSGRMAPPHQNDVALLRLAAGKQLLFVLEGVGGQVGVLNEVHEVAGSTHHIVRPPGAGDIGLALDVHLGNEGVCI